ncbi:STAS domain-containing protein [Streptomyces sp. NPDC051051]|uniref:STAS domain-containing protein n=1 Tax=Streptomyces sp. NPDC051051 TaxID=3155666 RepID=UPI00343D3D6C
MEPSSPTGRHTVRLALEGDLDYDTSGDVLHQVRLTILDREHVEDLRLDCRELEVVDSMGLSTLLQIHRSAHQEGVRFHLDNIGPALRRLLELTGTYDYLTVSPQGDRPGGSRPSST